MFVLVFVRVRASIGWVAAWGWLGCGPVVDQEGSTTGSTTSEPSTTISGSATSAGTTAPSTSAPGTSAPGTSATTIGPSDESSSTTGVDEGVSFIDTFDSESVDGGGCDVWAQDCPVGEKCMPWANDGGFMWNSVRCSPIGDGVPGAPCTVEGSAVSGIDSCQLAAMCWNVDPETNAGTCVGFCEGSRADPTCPAPEQHCVIANDGVLILCLPCCDPRLPSCGEDTRCIPSHQALYCGPVVGDGAGAIGDACDYPGECAAGLLCTVGNALPSCRPGSLGCCAPWCTIGDDAACEAAIPGTVCTPWLEEGTTPLGCDDATLGVCTLPV